MMYCEEAPIYGMSGVTNPPLLLGTFTPFYFVERHHTKHGIFVVPDQKALVLIFSGTYNLPNWIQDLDKAMAKPDPEVFQGAPEDARVHRGFQRQIRKLVLDDVKLIDRVEAALTQYPDYELVITGQSLGAALAALAYTHISSIRPDLQSRIRTTYTYGQPIVGNGPFSDYMGSLLITPDQFLYVNSQGDIVPRIMVNNATKHDELNQIRHSKHIMEVYLPDRKRRDQPMVCRYEENEDCLAGVPCDKLSWFGHMWYGGFRVSSWFCSISRHANLQPLTGTFRP